jgi:hypothetical protein
MPLARLGSTQRGMAGVSNLLGAGDCGSGIYPSDAGAGYQSMQYALRSVVELQLMMHPGDHCLNEERIAVGEQGRRTSCS